MVAPPNAAERLQRLNRDGTWGEDTGKPAIAFSGRLGRLPAAFGAPCKCHVTRSACPFNLARKRTQDRFGCAASVRVPAVG